MQQPYRLSDTSKGQPWCMSVPLGRKQLNLSGADGINQTPLIANTSAVGDVSACPTACSRIRASHSRFSPRSRQRGTIYRQPSPQRYRGVGPTVEHRDAPNPISPFSDAPRKQPGLPHMGQRSARLERGTRPDKLAGVTSGFHWPPGTSWDDLHTGWPSCFIARTAIGD